jgi:hypothetical protein
MNQSGVADVRKRMIAPAVCQEAFDEDVSANPLNRPKTSNTGQVSLGKRRSLVGVPMIIVLMNEDMDTPTENNAVAQFSDYVRPT